MTPITALLMGVFIRGRDALFFDHMVMALYGHAVAFAVVGAAILLTQLGVPMVGASRGAGFICLFHHVDKAGLPARMDQDRLFQRDGQLFLYRDFVCRSYFNHATDYFA